MSASWRSGSTRAWRRLRLFVLMRDGWTCRMAGTDGEPCGRQLRQHHPDPRHRATVEHLDPVSEGHPVLCHPDRLVAACQTHNSAGGARMTNARRPVEQERGWSW